MSGGLQTEYEFELPQGYVDGEGTLHREGRMRLATASDEIEPLKDPRVQSNSSYLTVILLSRVVTELGDLDSVNRTVIENLFVSDLEYLQDMYERINNRGANTVETACPECGHGFAVDATSGTPAGSGLDAGAGGGGSPFPEESPGAGGPPGDGGADVPGGSPSAGDSDTGNPD